MTWNTAALCFSLSRTQIRLLSVLYKQLQDNKYDAPGATGIIANH